MRVDPLQILTKLAAVQNIPTRRVTPPFEGLEEFNYGLRRSLDPQFDWQEFGQLLLDSTPENTLLLVEGTFELHFALFRIPDEKNTVFLIGPWTVGPRTPSARKWVRRYLGEAGEAAVQEYYNGVKILEASDFYGALRVVVDTMFGCTVPVQELKEFLPFQFHPDTRYFHEPEFQKEIPVTMLEQRYESENRILDAVARGDEEAAIEAMHQHSRFTYGGRFEGTLYQQKNKMIVLNTLLRKAIEPSKVHPYYIDAISSKYARIIEEARGDLVMEFGLRRAHGTEAGFYGARAAVIGGCAGTSVVETEQMLDRPAMGTMSHSFILSYDSELEAFEKYVKYNPDNATLLVDTYNTLEKGVPNAIKVFKKALAEGGITGRYGIRIDSGDLAYF